ncbi:TetR/AcrR family transcriptional regulator [uncultured Sulfitobacter sp.]|uniref:TetR/AcrR family transcriptional regulator n=1 Tax=uncultured Sulfitobacter sp. TaxID=191468 RepID=UPI00260D489B|nr:TetR/AcrR family transcriptional regulator [uncultured Sulfitobacter sp.]
MRSDKKQARHIAITDAAYQLLAQHGYEGTSMLSIAKAAKASNETLYRWYGDKQGLFTAMVADNAAATQTALTQALKTDAPPLQTLERVAPMLLEMLLGERAILLNRVAAADPTGGLGRAIAAGGRDTVLPMISQLLERAGADREAVEIYMAQLIGDQQIRRVIGVMNVPSADLIKQRCAQAQRVLTLMINDA